MEGGGGGKLHVLKKRCASVILKGFLSVFLNERVSFCEVVYVIRHGLQNLWS